MTRIIADILEDLHPVETLLVELVLFSYRTRSYTRNLGTAKENKTIFGWRRGQPSKQLLYINSTNCLGAILIEYL